MNRPLKIGSAFAGIGGFELGVESALSDAGVSCEISWQIEINPFCLQILKKHWPNAQRYTDIKTIEDIEPVDLLLAGFPCQDISVAGKGAGLDGERSGLFFELLGLVRRIEPRWILLENVAAILHNGGAEVLRELAACGYDARWQIIQASDAGAPHKRARWFALANANEGHSRTKKNPLFPRRAASNSCEIARAGEDPILANAKKERLQRTSVTECSYSKRWQVQNGSATKRSDLQGSQRATNEKANQPKLGRAAYGFSPRLDKPWRFPRGRGVEQAHYEAPRVKTREKGDAKRLRALGNAIVPQCAYMAAVNLGLVDMVIYDSL